MKYLRVIFTGTTSLAITTCCLVESFIPQALLINRPLLPLQDRQRQRRQQRRNVLFHPIWKTTRTPVWMTFQDDTDDTEDIDDLMTEISSAAQSAAPDPIEELRYTVEETSQRATEAEKRVMFLEEEVEAYKKELKEKEEKLRDESDVWALEKTQLVAKIAEFTGFSKGKPEEDDDSNTVELKNEIDSLRQKLVDAEEALETQREAASQLKDRLLNAEDELEFEQMRFDKEKSEFNEQLDVERSKLKSLSDDFEAVQLRFDAEQRQLQGELEIERNKVSELTEQREVDQQKFVEEKEKLLQQIQFERRRVEDLMNQLQNESNKFSDERRQLKDELAEALNQLNASQALLQERQQQFQKEADSINEKLVAELARVEELKIVLQEEQDRFAKEKKDLQFQVYEEQNKLSEIEATLEAESKRFEKEKEYLKYQVSEGDRIRQLKARQMNKRYSAIRSELTAKWEGAKREARKEKKRLVEKYETKLAVVTKKVTDLEEQLASRQGTEEDLQARLTVVTTERDSLRKEKQVMESKLLQSIANKNGEISSLKMSVSDLEEELRYKDEELERYESSYRALLRQSLRLTRERMRKSTSRIVNLVSRRKSSNN